MKRVIDANAPRGDNGKLRCVLCQVTMPSPQVAQTHFSGKKHQKKLAALKTAEQTQEEILNDSVCDLTSPGRFDCRRGVKEVLGKWNVLECRRRAGSCPHVGIIPESHPNRRHRNGRVLDSRHQKGPAPS